MFVKKCSVVLVKGYVFVFELERLANYATPFDGVPVSESRVGKLANKREQLTL